MNHELAMTKENKTMNKKNIDKKFTEKKNFDLKSAVDLLNYKSKCNDKELALLANCDTATFSRLRNNKGDVSALIYVCNLCSHFKITVEDFLNGGFELDQQKSSLVSSKIVTDECDLKISIIVTQNNRQHIFSGTGSETVEELPGG